MKKTIFPFLLFISISLFSQSTKEKGFATINKESAKAYIGFLASDAVEGREAGRHGGRVAGEYVKSVLQDMGLKPLNEDSYFQPFEAYSPERQKRVRFSVHPDSIQKYSQLPAHRKLELRNVLGYIEGKNKNEYVVMGAHYDHLGMDEVLDGDKIYNGADDNASGVSAVLQIAKAFLASGEKPERTIIFALWDAEELGLLGSEYFMQTCPFASDIKGYVNFDMIGRNNDEQKPKYVVYFYTEAHPQFGEWLKSDIKTYGLGLEPNYRPWDKPIGGSDNASFAKRDVSVIWYHTDGHPDYHQPSDLADKINWDKLVEITKAAYLNLWNLANLKTY
ncbi:M20/M25/M40 family metallo-hydrolase [Dysgonomonas mossii]|uniref:M20/M25/M40 family metallo-hydrolase n=1 Tax=Dysgonomonas mossii TaxID=163665 RepID=A0A4Y9IQJ7_9BACT|nr:M20/M25/M40 family metallo-hydrolase [Dysgonomonas mossii]MBF0759658.1 M20/M25/M40 family metallo-hydrolase [Dysgonomonas mossii]TFU90621.1 M20/M25/M40 family metallo-hydrolase [Dysgonomonas mossii]